VIGKIEYLLDTDTCIYLLNGNGAIKARISEVGLGAVAVSIPTVAELFFGAFNSSRPVANLARIRSFLSPPGPALLPFDERSAEHFGRFKADLRRRGITIGDVDLMIAGIAATHSLTIVTNNTGHFEDVPEISVTNWLKP
jgi:tRNA(fMet)-specific endonuclease VapC